jgi:hypothetical protein
MRAVGGALMVVLVMIAAAASSAGQASPPSAPMSAAQVEAILNRIGVTRASASWSG